MAFRPSPLNPLSHVIGRQYRADQTIKNKLFGQRLAHAKNLFRKDLLAHYGCVNAIEFSNDGDLMASGGDDRRVLLWSVTEAMLFDGTPVAMETNHASNIFCLGFDSGNTKLFSGGNDDQVIIHDTVTRHLIRQLPHKKPVYGLSVNPQNDQILATAGDDGRILIFDVRESRNADALCLAKQKTGFHSVMFNPTNPRWVLTANSDEGIALWDCRKPKDLYLQYDPRAGSANGISACFNAKGNRVLALRRRLPPVLYDTQTDSAICQFYHPQYYNSCTMKTCSFAGTDDEYVLSGSDDFNLYMWRVPQDPGTEWGRTHLVLRGHRSIVNQVRYNKHNNLIASSGVEKMVKLWSALPVGRWTGSLQTEHFEFPRAIYSHEDYIYQVGHGGERISHDYSDHSTMEDSKMMAFFDSLIQRELEQWESPPPDEDEQNGGGTSLGGGVGASRSGSSEDEDDDSSSNTESDNSEDSDDSDREERDLSKLLKIMFPNGEVAFDINNRIRSNKITELIAKKKMRLAKMAHEKSRSIVLRNQLKKDRHRRKKRKLSNTASSTKLKQAKKFKKNHNGAYVKNRTTKKSASSSSSGSSSASKLPPPPPPASSSASAPSTSGRTEDNHDNNNNCRRSSRGVGGDILKRIFPTNQEHQQQGLTCSSSSSSSGSSSSRFSRNRPNNSGIVEQIEENRTKIAAGGGTTMERKYRTRASLREKLGNISNNNSSSTSGAGASGLNNTDSITDLCNNNNNSLDAPSTSTGITGSNIDRVFRVIHEPDSDDELLPNAHFTQRHHHNNRHGNRNNNNKNNNRNNNSSNNNSNNNNNGDMSDDRSSQSSNNDLEEDQEHENEHEINNFVNILPTPLNGSHDMYIGVLEMTPGNVANSSRSSNNNNSSHSNNNNNSGSSLVAGRTADDQQDYNGAWDLATLPSTSRQDVADMPTAACLTSTTTSTASSAGTAANHSSANNSIGKSAGKKPGNKRPSSGQPSNSSTPNNNNNNSNNTNKNYFNMSCLSNNNNNNNDSDSDSDFELNLNNYRTPAKRRRCSVLTSTPDSGRGSTITDPCCSTTTPTINSSTTPGSSARNSSNQSRSSNSNYLQSLECSTTSSTSSGSAIAIGASTASTSSINEFSPSNNNVSGNSSNNNKDQQRRSSEKEFNFEKLRKRHAGKSRAHIRKKHQRIAYDSDSN